MTLQKAARTIIRTCMDVKKSETVLIVTDKNKLQIGNAIKKQAEKICKKAEIVIIPVGKVSGEEPPADVARLMKKFDVVICPTTKSLTHTNARREACKAGARIATLPGITEAILRSCLDADYRKISKDSLKLKRFLDRRRGFVIRTKSGTSFSFIASGRKWHADVGLIWKKGDCGNLPAGEVFIAPLERTANGIIVIDVGREFAKKGTRLVVKNGEVVNISDKRCGLAKLFKRIGKGSNVAEVGIGTNYKAFVIGNILQDEKAIGTCHIAFGNSSAIGGKVYSKMHIDTILAKPTIYSNGRVLMKSGKLVI